MQQNPKQTRSRSLPHIADTKLAKYQFYELSLSSLSADVLQWSAWVFVAYIIRIYTLAARILTIESKIESLVLSALLNI